LSRTLRERDELLPVPFPYGELLPPDGVVDEVVVEALRGREHLGRRRRTRRMRSPSRKYSNRLLPGAFTISTSAPVSIGVPQAWCISGGTSR